MTNDTNRPGQTGSEIEVEGAESTCAYLPGERSTMMYRLALSLSEVRYEALLSRGWRRFGRTLFRPVCAACRECRSLRVVIPEFRMTKSQRRNRSKNEHVQVIIQRPTLSNEHLSLYNRYHLDMHHRRRWPFREITRDQYFESFLDGNFSFAREFQYRLNGQLVGLGLVDMTATAMSSIYFVHDPEHRDVALGTYSVLREIAEAERTGRQRLYMGYYIRDCPSMNYKNRFGPFETLQEYVADDVPPVWLRADSSGAD